MSDDKLKSLAERIENLMDERDGIQSDIRDIYAEAKGVGYVPKVLRKAITRKRMDASKRNEEDAILELYEGALSGPLRKAVEMAKAGASSHKIEQATGIDHATVARSVALNKKSATAIQEPRSPEIAASDSVEPKPVQGAEPEVPTGNEGRAGERGPAFDPATDELEIPPGLRRTREGNGSVLRSQEAAPPRGGNTRDELVQ